MERWSKSCDPYNCIPGGSVEVRSSQKWRCSLVYCCYEFCVVTVPLTTGTFWIPGGLVAITTSDPPLWTNVPPGFVATTLTVVALLMTPTGVVVADTFVTAFPEVVARVAPVKNDPCVVVAAPAFAQGDPGKAEANKAEEQKKKETEQVERAYKDMLKRTTREQPAKKTDPWDNLR
jgi:hypothetical protein